MDQKRKKLQTTKFRGVGACMAECYWRPMREIENIHIHTQKKDSLFNQYRKEVAVMHLNYSEVSSTGKINIAPV